jgi:hypothetical protein
MEALIDITTASPSLSLEGEEEKKPKPKPRVKKEGLVQVFNKKGRLLHETTYLGGKKHGLEVIHRREYTLYAHYWKGTLHGPSRAEKNGRVVREVMYVNGQTMGIGCEYSDSEDASVSEGDGKGKRRKGRLVSQQQYIGNWKREGPELVYMKSGDLCVLNNRTFGLSELELREGFRADVRSWMTDSDVEAENDFFGDD